MTTLKAEAERIIKDLSIPPMLSRHGEARVAGSVALNLIMKLDVDIHVLVPQAPRKTALGCMVSARTVAEKSVVILRADDAGEKGPHHAGRPVARRRPASLMRKGVGRIG